MPRSLEKLLHGYLLHQVPMAKGEVVEETTPLRTVVNLMREKKTGCVITMSDKTVTGIFTERDLLTKVIDEAIDWTSPISQFTTKRPETMGHSERLEKALYLMKKKNFGHITVFDDDNNLIGVLSVRNIVRLLAEHFPTEVLNLPPRVNSNPSTVEGG